MKISIKGLPGASFEWSPTAEDRERAGKRLTGTTEMTASELRAVLDDGSGRADRVFDAINTTATAGEGLDVIWLSRCSRGRVVYDDRG